ncbi:MAG: hypothetical protein Q9195_001905 [Heterodermia aff. obscurata]
MADLNTWKRDAYYSLERHEWQFTRNIGFSERFRLLEGPTLTLASGFVGEPRNSFEFTHVRKQKARDITSNYPQTKGAARLLPSILQSSNFIEDYCATHDPFESDLLAFGHAVDVDRSFSRNLERVHLAALPGGRLKDHVVLVCLNQDNFGWQDQEDIHLNSTTFRNGERTIWQGQRGPIKQLCFSPQRPKNRKWLAVRFLGATVILQPEFHRDDKGGNSVPRTGLGVADNWSSRIQPNEILVLPIKHTGGASHSHIAFNPFIADQFAVIDQQGSWNIFNIERHHRHQDLWDLRLWRSGYVDVRDHDATDSSNALKDGFGRISWVQDSNTLFVASRTSLGLFSLQGSVRRLAIPPLVKGENAEYILDAKADPVDNTLIYVVTSTRVICLRINAHGSSGGLDLTAGAKVLASWRHLRSFADLSLRVSICRTIHSTTVILNSCVTGLITVTTLVGPSSTSTLQLSISGPCLLALKGDTPQEKSVDAFHGRQHSFVSLVLREMVHRAKKPSISSDSAIMSLEERTGFYQLIALGNNLDIFEYLLVDDAELPLHMPNTRNLVTSSKSSAKIAPEHFIVPDTSDDGDDSSDRLLENAKLKPRPYESHSNDFEAASGSRPDQWTLNMAWLQDLLQQVRGGDSTDFSEALDNIQERINVLRGNSTVASKSLFELLNTELIIGDVDVASDSLKNTLRALTPESIGREMNEMIAQRTILSHTMTKSLARSLGFGIDTDLSRTYDHIVRVWVSPLPLQAPGRVRLLTEQLARMIAAQLCLACYRVISGTPHKKSLDEDQEHQPQNQHTSPLRHESSAIYISQEGEESAQAKTGTLNSVTNSPNPAFPTPESPPSLPSRGSNSSRTAVESLASQRIRSQVLHMRSQAYPDTSITRTISHWDEGLDPSFYDWEESERAIATLHDSTEVDESSQRRKGRRTERQRKRFKESAIGSSFDITSREAESSQHKEGFESQEGTEAMEPIVMSQVEPEVHRSQKKIMKGQGPKRNPGFR